MARKEKKLIRFYLLTDGVIFWLDAWYKLT